MKTMFAARLAGGGLITLASLAPAGEGTNSIQHPSPPAARAAKPAVANTADLPVICHLEKRGKIITVRAGADGPVYTVKNTSGKVLAENLSREQLRAQAPEVEEFLKSAFAGSATKGARVVDASLRVRALAR